MPAAPTRPPARSAVRAVCFGVIFADMVAYGVISPSLPLLARTLAASDAHMGYAFAGYPIALTLAILPLGALVDRLGRNGLIVSLSMGLLAVATTLIAFASDIWTLIAARGLQGLASAASWVATQPLVAEGADPKDRGAQSMSVVTIAAGVGVIVGPLLGGVGDVETPFLINAALAATCAAAAALVLPRQRELSPHKNLAFRDLMKSKAIAIACVAIFCSCACFGLMELLLPLRLDRLGYAKLSIGLLFGVFSILYVATQPLMGRWIDRRGSYEPIYVGSLGLCLAMLFVVHATGSIAWGVMMSVMGACSGALFLASMFLIGANSEEGQRGSAYALWNLAYALGYLVGPAAGGSISTALSLPAAFYTFASVLLIGAFGIFLAARRSVRSAPL